VGASSAASGRVAVACGGVVLALGARWERIGQPKWLWGAWWALQAPRPGVLPSQAAGGGAVLALGSRRERIGQPKSA